MGSNFSKRTKLGPEGGWGWAADNVSIVWGVFSCCRSEQNIPSGPNYHGPSLLGPAGTSSLLEGKCLLTMLFTARLFGSHWQTSSRDLLLTGNRSFQLRGKTALNCFKWHPVLSKLRKKRGVNHSLHEAELDRLQTLGVGRALWKHWECKEWFLNPLALPPVRSPALRDPELVPPVLSVSCAPKLLASPSRKCAVMRKTRK